MNVLRQTAYENNKKYIGKEVRVLLEGKNKKGKWNGRIGANKNVQVINCEDEELKIGLFVNVKIKEVQDFGLKGVLI